MRIRKRRQNPWIGLGAGLIGGLAGSVAIGQFHRLWGKATRSNLEQEGMESTVKAANAVSENVLDHELTDEEKPKAAGAVHFAFGGAMGALYGALASVEPNFAGGWGLPFGGSVYAGAHAVAVPALGLSDWPTQKQGKDEAGEFLGHLVYGVVTDLTRRAILSAARRLD